MPASDGGGEAPGEGPAAVPVALDRAIAALGKKLARPGANGTGPRVDLVVDAARGPRGERLPRIRTRVQAAPDGPVEVASFLDDACLDVGHTSFPGKVVKLWECHHGKDEATQGVALTLEGQLRIASRNICIEAVGPNRPVTAVPCAAGSPLQAWTHTPRPARWRPAGPLVNGATGLCLASRGNHNPVVTTACSQACSQSWLLPGTQVAVPLAADTVEPAVAARRQRAGRILCWILTMPEAHETKARAVNETWGRHCDTLLFITTAMHDSLPTVVVDIGGPESRYRLWIKSKRAWEHVFQHYFDKAEWFMKADDDTYVVWENLVAFLSKYNTSEPHHFGRILHLYGNAQRSYYSGGAGIILSKEALRRLGTAVLANPGAWRGRDNGPEDLYTTDSLRPLGVETESTVDEKDRQLFFTLGIRTERSFKKDPTHWWARGSPPGSAVRPARSPPYVFPHTRCAGSGSTRLAPRKEPPAARTTGCPPTTPPCRTCTKSTRWRAPSAPPTPTNSPTSNSSRRRLLPNS